MIKHNDKLMSILNTSQVKKETLTTTQKQTYINVKHCHISRFVCIDNDYVRILRFRGRIIILNNNSHLYPSTKMANKLYKRQNDDLLSLFMELPARTDLIDSVDNDPLMSTHNTCDTVTNIDSVENLNSMIELNAPESKNTNSIINCQVNTNCDDNAYNSSGDANGDDDDEKPLSKYVIDRSYSLRESKKKRNVQESNNKKTRKSKRTESIQKRNEFTLKFDKKNVCANKNHLSEINNRSSDDFENSCEYDESILLLDNVIKTEKGCIMKSIVPKNVQTKNRKTFKSKKKIKTTHQNRIIGNTIRNKGSKYKIKNGTEFKMKQQESIDSNLVDNLKSHVLDDKSQEQKLKSKLVKKIIDTYCDDVLVLDEKNDEELSNDDRNADDFFDEVVPEKKKKNLKKYTCIICNLLTSCKGAYKAHLLRKHDLIYVYGCVMCDMKFESMELLMAHRKNDHYDVKTNGFACTKCDRTFKEFHKLIVHLKDTHELEIDKDVQYCVDKNVKTILNGTNVIGNDEDSSRTVVFKSPTVKGRNGKELKETNKIKKPYKTSVCHLCGKVFNFLGQFKEHLLKHDNIKNYVCDVCQKAFISKRILTIHKKIHDSISDRKYVCGFVFNEFDSNEKKESNESERCSNRNATDTPVLTNEFDSKTSFTGYKENNGTEGNKNLTYETSTEDNKNMIEVRILNRKNRKPNIDARITHNGAYIVTDDYGRRICSFACVSKSDLNKHRLVHLNLKPFTCPICAMSFRQTAHLRRHIKRHTGTKEYKCDICKMEFVTKDNLNNHLRTHSDVLPFICEICGKTFLQRTQCMKHVRNCHPVRSKPYSQNYNELPVVEKQCEESVPAQSVLPNCQKTELVNIVEPLPECNNVNTSLGIWV